MDSDLQVNIQLTKAEAEVWFTLHHTMAKDIGLTRGTDTLINIGVFSKKIESAIKDADTKGKVKDVVSEEGTTSVS
jgi:hypothetical protein